MATPLWLFKKTLEFQRLASSGGILEGMEITNHIKKKEKKRREYDEGDVS